MKSILTLLLSVQLPSSYSDTLVPPAPTTQAEVDANREAIRRLQETTVSVMKRPEVAQVSYDAVLAMRQAAPAAGAKTTKKDAPAAKSKTNEKAPAAKPESPGKASAPGAPGSRPGWPNRAPAATAPGTGGVAPGTTSPPAASGLNTGGTPAPGSVFSGARGNGTRDADKGTPAAADDTATRDTSGATANPNLSTGTTRGTAGDAEKDASDSAAPAESSAAAARGSVDAARGGVDAATRAAASASAALLSDALSADDEGVALAGRRLSLVDAVGRGRSHTHRLEIASLYWRVALAVAEYNWAAEHSAQLHALPIEERTAIDSPLLATARAAAMADMKKAQANAVAAQQELADALGQSIMELPLPEDQPIVGPYRTHFATLFATRPAPGRTRAIDRTLPLRREAIEIRTAAVQAATQAVRSAEETYARGETALETMLVTRNELKKQRQEFLNSVREYNADIVDYAVAVVTPNTSPAVLASMLTKTRSNKISGSPVGPGGVASQFGPTPADPTLDPEVQQASAVEPEAEEQEWQNVGEARSDANEMADHDHDTRLRPVLDAEGVSATDQQDGEQ